MLSNLWIANNAVSVYVWYTSSFMCLHIFKLLRAANNIHFWLFYVDFTSCKFVVIFSLLINFNQLYMMDEFFTVRSATELHIPHGFLKGSVLKVF